MNIKRDNVSALCLPDGAYCKADDEKRCPLDNEECPLGYEECSGDCYYYDEN